jgi:hypothetical protein
MSKKIRYGLLILLPTFLFLGLFSTVEAQEATPDVRPLHGRRGLLGQITGIDSSTLTVGTPVGQLAIHTDEETHFRIIGQEDAGLGDLSPGDQVFIRGIRRDDG